MLLKPFESVISMMPISLPLSLSPGCSTGLPVWRYAQMAEAQDSIHLISNNMLLTCVKQ